MKNFFEKALNNGDLPRETVVSIARSLLKQNQLSQTVFSSVSTGVLVLNNELKVIDFNRQAARFFPLLKKKSKGLEPVLRSAELVSFLRETASGVLRYQCRDFSFLKGKEESLVLEVFCDPLVQEGRIIGMVVQLRDVTERECEHQRNDVTERLNSLLNLTAAVAHEIKNPLGAMSLYIEILKKRIGKVASGDGKVIECVEILSEEMERLNGIVTDFLMTIRPLDLVADPVDLTEVVEEVGRLVRYDLENRRIDFIVKRDDDLPRVRVDVNKIKQVLLNLINNSIHAMPEGGHLSIGLFRKDDRVALTVADTGTGIPRRLLPRIFDPYFTTTSSGTGLGLTLVYQIIKKHNGEIFVDSEENKGTTFTLLFPVPQKEISLLAEESRT